LEETWPDHAISSAVTSNKLLLTVSSGRWKTTKRRNEV